MQYVIQTLFNISCVTQRRKKLNILHFILQQFSKEIPLKNGIKIYYSFSFSHVSLYQLFIMTRNVYKSVLDNKNMLNLVNNFYWKILHINFHDFYAGFLTISLSFFQKRAKKYQQRQKIQQQKPRRHRVRNQQQRQKMHQIKPRLERQNYRQIQ